VQVRDLKWGASKLMMAVAFVAVVAPAYAGTNGGAQAGATPAGDSDKHDSDPKGSDHVSSRASGSAIIVTARRKALQASQEIKRNSDTIVDSVTADEAGKLPDNSITEVLQRVSGVVISRFPTTNGGSAAFQIEGTGVAVRGLPYNTSNVNGEQVFSANTPALAKDILNFKRDVSSLRRVVQPQRDVVGRLARREFEFIDEQVAYRFRDVHDHLVRIADESMFFQDRITSLLDANLAIVSNQLNTVMKILTVIATVFMPLTFITGLYGMNVDLPHLGLGGTGMFWLLMAVMSVIVGIMLMVFRKRNWI